MTQKFNVGDRVRVIPGHQGSHFEANEVVTVRAVQEGYIEVRGSLAQGEYYFKRGDRFELVEAAAPKPRALKGDNKLVFQALADGTTWSVQELEQYIRSHSDRKPTAATITARIRDLRKPIYGGFKIERIQQGKLHFYKLVQG